jgi:hypothetical protein
VQLTEGRYTRAVVERLLGMHESESNTGVRHTTVIDILSWARDPGGDLTWLQLVRSNDPEVAWRVRRGPLDLESPAALLLWDFLRAMTQLSTFEQAIVALRAFGFSPTEIGAVIDPDSILPLEQERHGKFVLSKELDGRRKRIVRALEGREMTKVAEGKRTLVTDEEGNVIYRGGAVRKLTRLMNKGGAR